MDTGYYPHLFQKVIWPWGPTIPTNPPGAEQITQIEAIPLEMVISRFATIGRYDLAELYQLAAQLGDYR